MLPAGLATIAATWDDTPHARAAIAVCHAMTDRREAEARVAAVPDRMIEAHAALAVQAAYRSADTRAIVFRQHGVETVG